MYKPRKPNIQSIQRDVQGVVRTFPSEHMAVTRPALVQDSTTGEQVKDFTATDIWAGEALVRPVSGTVQRLQLGQINTEIETVLIPGVHDIRMGDFVTRKDRLYQVQRAPRFFGAYTVLDMSLYQQQPPV